MFEVKTIMETEKQLNTNIASGLSSAEANRRLKENGENVLAKEKPKHLLTMILEQLNEPLIFVLFVAAAVSMLLKEFGDMAIIFIVIAINTAAGVIQEGKALRAMEALKRLSAPTADVIRDNSIKTVQASCLTEGDIVILEAGRIVPADLRLVKTAGLRADESALTGESMTAVKEADFMALEPLSAGDCKNMAFMSTNITNGRGIGIVTATGMKTEIGKIAGMLHQTGNEMTPLQKRLGQLGKILSGAAVFLCAALFFIAVLQHRNIPEMLITAISLAVAAVPEGLPAVVTIVLALSVSRMVQVNTIIRRLPCVETLGCVSVVCSDKTGTLTANKMTVTTCYSDMRLMPISQLDDTLFVQGFCLCNDARFVKGGEAFGDSTETALLNMAVSAGYDAEEFLKNYPRIDELPFDSARKMMTTLHKNGSRTIQFTKGSPDVLLARCSHVLIHGTAVPMTAVHRQHIENALRTMSREALRVLALTMRMDRASLKKGAIKDDAKTMIEDDLIFIGMAGMADEARPEAKASVAAFAHAGIKTVMITGDYMDTAFAIAKKLGIAKNKEECMSGAQIDAVDDAGLQKIVKTKTVFARVTPEHKMRIVRAYKANGEVVAMTGDGVNDAPSLKAADIGIAMGKNGTDTARSAADMILADDRFSTIEKAIEEGRGIYANIKKSVIFLLSSNFGEIMTMFTAIVLGLASPLKASHILWINLITDSLPALALGIDKNDVKSMMSHPPRPLKESLFAEGGLFLTCFYGILIALISLTAFFKVPYDVLRSAQLPVTIQNISAVLGETEVLFRAQTYAFTVLGISQLFHAVGMRNAQISVFKMGWKKSGMMLFALASGFILQLAVTEIPYLVKIFGTVCLSVKEWGSLLILSVLPLVAHELLTGAVNKMTGRFTLMRESDNMDT